MVLMKSHLLRRFCHTTGVVVLTGMTVSTAMAPVPILPGDIGSPFELPTTGTFRATITAYTSSFEETDEDPWITASGREPESGMVACPRRFAFGTKLRIGERVYECADRLHPRYDTRFDIWMETKEDARAFGRRRLRVEVLE
jgi:3D (Asp-Asp-Asp) domain-containing protein